MDSENWHTEESDAHYPIRSRDAALIYLPVRLPLASDYNFPRSCLDGPVAFQPIPCYLFTHHLNPFISSEKVKNALRAANSQAFLRQKAKREADGGSRHPLPVSNSCRRGTATRRKIKLLAFMSRY